MIAMILMTIVNFKVNVMYILEVYDSFKMTDATAFINSYFHNNLPVWASQ